ASPSGRPVAGAKPTYRPGRVGPMGIGRAGLYRQPRAHREPPRGAGPAWAAPQEARPGRAGHPRRHRLTIAVASGAAPVAAQPHLFGDATLCRTRHASCTPCVAAIIVRYTIDF